MKLIPEISCGYNFSVDLKIKIALKQKAKTKSCDQISAFILQQP